MTPAEVIAQALARHPWNSYPHAAHGEHNYDSACGVCRGDVEALANVALYALAGAGMVVVSAEDLKNVNEALKLCGNLIATHSRDWGQSGSDAILWGVLCGWECEEDHEHDDICGGSAALEQVAARFDWTPDRIDQIKRLRRAVAALPERTENA